MALDFGVELEMMVPGAAGFRNRVAEGMARDITELGVPCAFEGYNHHLRSNWKIVTDASLTAPDGYYGLELVSPPLNDASVSQIDTVCGAVQRMGAKVNKTCGLHVHIGARHLELSTMRRLALLYLENEDVIDSLMPPSRRKNNNARYCSSLKASANVQRIQTAHDVQSLAAAIRESRQYNSRHHMYEETPSRFVKLNFTSHWKHGTVEFRQHSGTVDAEKVKRWVVFCQKMVDVAQLEQSIAVAPAIGDDRQLAERLRKVKVAAVIYELARRPEGVTPSEARDALGWRNAPRPSIDLGRLGVQWFTEGHRNREKVYKVPAGSPPAATLDGLLEKLGLTEADNRFWRERAALLRNAEGVARDLATDENPSQTFHQAGVVTGRWSARG